MSHGKPIGSNPAARAAWEWTWNERWAKTWHVDYHSIHMRGRPVCHYLPKSEAAAHVRIPKRLEY